MIGIARMYVDDQRQKLAAIGQRLETTISRFSDKEINWRPNPGSNSAANLVMHVCGNAGQYFGHLIDLQPNTRDRAAEFDSKLKKKVAELVERIRATFAMIDGILARMPLAMLYNVVRTGDRELTIHELIAGCTAHYSEHLGQILYLEKMRPFPKR